MKNKILFPQIAKITLEILQNAQKFNEEKNLLSWVKYFQYIGIFLLNQFIHVSVYKIILSSLLRSDKLYFYHYLHNTVAYERTEDFFRNTSMSSITHKHV